MNTAKSFNILAISLNVL